MRSAEAAYASGIKAVNHCIKPETPACVSGNLAYQMPDGQADFADKRMEI
jgi:hypothetical protein